MSGFAGRPFKVWNADRSIKKSLMAANLAELIDKGRAKLGSPNGDVRVVLEADGTEVDEEDYFSFLNSDATLMLLTPSDKWRPAGLETGGKDEPDTANQGSGLSLHAKQLLSHLKQDVTRIITFSDEDLQNLVGISAADLARELGETERYAHAVQDACQRHLDERQHTKEAVDLLRLYHEARKVSPYVDAPDGGAGKKRRHSPQPGQS
ncbi:DNA fragmentation factor subunit alpha-like isoform X2 [Littorina saxatilis]|uniref:DNA fragmentation factor subunit alpha-like isoform X2 n=1 Tax=Littorina saxatilis TaxID=31220 RepID=UPI0038B4DCFF